MSRMRKHVEDTRRFESKPMFVDQHPQVPREAPRVTGNIQHPLGVETDYRCQHLEGTGTWRVEHHVCIALAEPGRRSRNASTAASGLGGRLAGRRGKQARQVGYVKLRVFQLISLCIVTSAGHQGRIAFDTDNTPGVTGHGQREVAYAAEEVQYFRGRAQLEELDGL